ncbi:hypothetical protein J6590_050109 [Homalodisca vitripennis]|nr:hypothetical protein J6590_050109 [Homalodisca vitripennis]
MESGAASADQINGNNSTSGLTGYGHRAPETTGLAPIHRPSNYGRISRQALNAIHAVRLCSCIAVCA